MSYIKPLRHEVEKYLDKKQIEQVNDAYLCAEAAHAGQKRASGEPYITHPVAVGKILAEMRLDAESIMAAILHDVIEDTQVNKLEISAQFGEQVAELVDGVSKLTQIKFESKAEAQAENFRKMVLAMARDIRVILIKLADRLHNMRTLGVLEPRKKARIALETLQIYAPIAHRLGMHNFRIEFEDLGFSALHPMRYRVIEASVHKADVDHKKILSTIEKALKTSLTRAGISFSKLIGREKYLYSIYKKMRDKNLPFSEIMDVYGFRIIVDKEDTCYRVLGVVHSLYKPVAERFKDYIAIPKANGYQSLHTTLFGPFGSPIEIQIRTEEMNRLAENGIAAHWLYKTGMQSANDTQLRAREWLKRLLELQQSTGNSIEFFENVKIDLFPDEVYVFSPKGGIFELPRGSTAVDFAYAVHSDIGNSCVAAKIDRQLAPLSTVLTNGQTVEIITAPKARPNPAWLEFIVSSKARSSIRDFLKHQRRAESRALGQRLLESVINMPVKQLPAQKLNLVLEKFHFRNINALFESIGLGDQTALSIGQHLIGDNKSLDTKAMTNSSDHPFIIKSSDSMVVQFAKCCCPIPGDDIVGSLASGEGVIIHAKSCKKVRNLAHHPEKYIFAQWDTQVTGEFRLDLDVEIADQRGTLATLAHAIAHADSNIENIHLDQRDGRYSWIALTIAVHDRIHLARVIRRIRMIKAVVRVMRKRVN